MNQIKAVIAPLDPGEEPVSGVADKWIYIVISIEIDKGAQKIKWHILVLAEEEFWSRAICIP